MKIPKLNPKENRSREYELHKDSIKEMVYAYLFEGRSYREIDEMFLGLDGKTSKGYQSMNALHYIGIDGKFKGIFKDQSLDDAISLVEASLQNKHEKLLDLLLRIEGHFEHKNTHFEYEGNREGKSYYQESKIYERDLKNREIAIRIHGTTCCICGFNFEDTYGEYGKGYIEIHHIRPLHTINEELIINPEKDLVPVCSNCHRIIHRKKNDTLTIERVKRIIKES